MDADGRDVVGAYDGDGALAWASQFGSANDDLPNAIAPDASGRVLVAGVTQGDLAAANLGSDDAFVRSNGP